jgi:hypothetical protein
MMLTAALGLTLGIGVAIGGGATKWAADEAPYAAQPTATPSSTYRRDEGDWAQLTTRPTANVELAYVTTTRGESNQTSNQNEGVGG